MSPNPQRPLGKQTQPIDTAHLLMVGRTVARHEQRIVPDAIAVYNVPVQGGVAAADRVREAVQVVEYWPEDLQKLAAHLHVPWHSLAEAARSDVPAEFMVENVRAYLSVHGHWPTVGVMRRWLGRPSNHRPRGDAPGQGALEV